MKMSVWVTILDHIQSHRIRGTFDIKEPFADKVKHRGNEWFNQIESNVA